MLRSVRVVVGGVAAAVSASVLVACSDGSGQGGETSPLPSQVTESTSPSSSTPTPTPTPTPSGTVPLDQIPNGRPASWIPAGVSANAPYKEPGDRVPKFNLIMFNSSQDGAVAAANYYQFAENWIAAANSSAAMMAICADSTCSKPASYVDKIAAQGRHIVGQRVTYDSFSFRAANPGAKGQVLVEFNASFAKGNLVDRSGNVVATFTPFKQAMRLYMKWTGIRWVVGGQYLAK